MLYATIVSSVQNNAGCNSCFYCTE